VLALLSEGNSFFNFDNEDHGQKVKTFGTNGKDLTVTTNNYFGISKPYKNYGQG
jgi:hypothetical protein